MRTKLKLPHRTLPSTEKESRITRSMKKGFRHTAQMSSRFNLPSSGIRGDATVPGKYTDLSVDGEGFIDQHPGDSIMLHNSVSCKEGNKDLVTTAKTCLVCSQ